jgi:glycogen operon protein
MTQKEWQRQDAHTLGVFLNGQEIPGKTASGEGIADDSFLLLFNAYGEPITFTLPTRRFGARWEVELATGEGAPEGVVPARAQVTVDSRALILLRRV